MGQKCYTSRMRREVPWQLIATKICTWINKTGVIACAKFGDDWFLCILLLAVQKCPFAFKTEVTITTACTIACGRDAFSHRYVGTVRWRCANSTNNVNLIANLKAYQLFRFFDHSKKGMPWSRSVYFDDVYLYSTVWPKGSSRRSGNHVSHILPASWRVIYWTLHSVARNGRCISLIESLDPQNTELAVRIVFHSVIDFEIHWEGVC